tara:strand:+ start:801 stop:1322 length:522 start_codon:yes stop_codon:yes gene_type:complete
MKRRNCSVTDPFVPIDEKDAEHRAFAWALHDVFRLFQRSWNKRLRDSGLGVSPAQSRILTEIYRQGGLTQTALADILGMEKAPLGRLLDRIEEMGLIERKPDPSDRRARLVFHTQKAESLDEPMWGVGRSMFDTALKGLSSDEITQIMTIFDHLKQNLQADFAASDANSPAAD